MFFISHSYSSCNEFVHMIETVIIVVPYSVVDCYINRRKVVYRRVKVSLESGKFLFTKA